MNIKKLNKRLDKLEKIQMNEMPSILREQGFVFSIKLPPREHWPPYVDIDKSGNHLELWIGDDNTNPVEIEVKVNKGMPDQEVTKAKQITKINQNIFLKEWRRLHGNKRPKGNKKPKKTERDFKNECKRGRKLWRKELHIIIRAKKIFYDKKIKSLIIKTIRHGDYIIPISFLPHMANAPDNLLVQLKPMYKGIDLHFPKLDGHYSISGIIKAWIKETDKAKYYNFEYINYQIESLPESTGSCPNCEIQINYPEPGWANNGIVDINWSFIQIINKKYNRTKSKELGKCIYNWTEIHRCTNCKTIFKLEANNIND